ncbi:hypothetical protein DSC45_04375 [Streptomyces sp. YIM 130001]|uniref:hypothetical protein n=1 Tax=Streptomyces sp. YIM 130001 TaxID=2259644 RepID=UPI000ED55166|nr:hypothetical protein [Streptomyces sp. YIM 130001]RII20441.1 hypothetical protein DSC45_04375 [Streptomyces sp. YIM 130001]
MLRSHRRKTVLTAAALMATTALLTSCQGGDSGSKKSSGSGSSASDSDAKGKSDDDKGGADGTEAQSGNGSGGGSGGKAGGKAVTGTWFGNVAYLAPGKYTVTDMKDTKQAFFTSTDTDIQGAGKICGDAEGQAATPCTEDQLEAASKKGVSATVKIKNGTAVSIVEDHSSSGGGDGGGENGSGTWSGDLGYMAPGKYSIADEKGAKRAFFTSTSTDINGAGWICGDASDITPCTEDQLEAAAKKGVAVVVKIAKGVAVTIDEEHN